MNEEMRKKHFLLLQINDSLFPIGAYSHSYGLETYIQKNLLTDLDQVWSYIHNRMVYGFCYNEFLAAKLAYEDAQTGDVQALCELEDILDASRVPRETREAAKKLGSRFVKTMRGMDIPFVSGVYEEYIACRKGQPMTHSVVYGTFCAAAGITLEDAMEHFLYAQASSMVTNCVKTIPLSQTDGQHLLYRSSQIFEEVLEKLEGLTIEDLCLSAPGFDIRCMQHEGLYSRIYMS